MSDFVAFDADGVEITAGQLSLVGTRSGRSFALAQADLGTPLNTAMTFQCTHKASKRVISLGTHTGGLSPLGLKLVLKRVHDR